MIAIRTRRIRGMVMERTVRIGPLTYEFDRVGATERRLGWRGVIAVTLKSEEGEGGGGNLLRRSYPPKPLYTYSPYSNMGWCVCADYPRLLLSTTVTKEIHGAVSPLAALQATPQPPTRVFCEEKTSVEQRETTRVFRQKSTSFVHTLLW